MSHRIDWRASDESGFCLMIRRIGSKFRVFFFQFFFLIFVQERNKRRRGGKKSQSQKWQFIGWPVESIEMRRNDFEWQAKCWLFERNNKQLANRKKLKKKRRFGNITETTTMLRMDEIWNGFREDSDQKRKNDNSKSANGDVVVQKKEIFNEQLMNAQQIFTLNGLPVSRDGDRDSAKKKTLFWIEIFEQSENSNRRWRRLLAKKIACDKPVDVHSLERVHRDMVDLWALNHRNCHFWHEFPTNYGWMCLIIEGNSIENGQPTMFGSAINGSMMLAITANSAFCHWAIAHGLTSDDCQVESSRPGRPASTTLSWWR